MMADNGIISMVSGIKLMPKRSPLAYRKHARTPTVFPAAVSGARGIRWILVEEETINVIPEPYPTPIAAPALINWDWGYVIFSPSSSMDFGLITSPVSSTGYDFGYIS
jgi:hypothetical protein